MSELVPLALLLALAFVVMPILGTVAFFRVRRLQRDVDALQARLDAGAPVQFESQEEPEPAPDDIDPAVGDGDGTADAWGIPPQEPQPEPLNLDEEAVARAEPAERTADKREDVVSTDTGTNLEETVGAKWAVWVGGLALALGGVFLVRYSIEQGLLGPGMRILLGAAFSALLIGAGEWTRQRGAAYAVGGFETANIPAIVTAAGTLAAFATVFAAYQIYGFLSPLAAFVILGIVSVATMVAALLHGPILAALGLVGSYFVPFLVATQQPSAIGLALYAFAVSVAAFGVGRLRLWRWLAVIAALGLAFFGVVLLLIDSQAQQVVVGLYILVAWIAIFYVFVTSLYPRSAQEFFPNDRVAVVLLALISLLALIFVTVETGAGTVVGLVLIIFVPFAASYYWSAARYIVPVAVIVAAVGYGSWDIGIDTWAPLVGNADTIEQLNPIFMPGYKQQALSMFGVLGIVLAALAATLGFAGARWSASRVPLAFGGAFTPVLLLAVAYARTDFLDISLRYGIIALLLSVALYGVAMHMDRHIQSEDANGRDGVVATCLLACLGVFALGLCMVLDQGTLTVALALMAPATALVYTYRPVASLRPFALLPALLWGARIAWDPAIVGSSLGTTPVFNWLLFGYGVPAAGFVMTAWLLGKQTRDLWLEIIEGVAVAAVTAALALLGLHMLDPLEVFTGVDTLSEAALLVFVGGGVALGLTRMKRTRNSLALGTLADVLGFLGMAAAVFGLLGFYNPAITGEFIGSNTFLNKLLFAYFFTGVLYTALGFSTAHTRQIYSRAAYSVGGLLLFAWVTLTIRHWFHPVALNVGAETDAELYAYSAAWLVIGIATLSGGLIAGIRTLRLLSGVIIVVVVAKVFVIDMSNLTGILRALSFIGLGVVLVVIGLLYQRLLRRRA